MENSKNKMYEAVDEIFIKVNVLTDTYNFFYNTYEQNHSDYTAKENVQICNLLNIFDQYSKQIRADISNIREQVMTE